MKEKESMNLKDSRSMYMGGSRGRKGKGEL